MQHIKMKILFKCSHCSIENKHIFVKGYWFLSFAKNIGKYLSGKYSQKLFGYAKQSATNALRTTSKRVIQKNNKI